MIPSWDPAEEDSDLYQKVHRHSDGMISLTVTRDATRSQQIGKTIAFREFVRLEPDADEASLAEAPENP